MANGAFVAYYRVSTAKQGASGLGLEAQQAAVRDYLNGGSWRLVAEFTEVESGKVNDRPRLADALKQCRMTGAVLVIAKLDRLSRDAHFLLGLEKGGVEFVCCDMPSANRLTVGIMALVAEEERRLISARTKAALAAAKARGMKLGGVRSARCYSTAALDEMRTIRDAKVAAAANDRAALLRPLLDELKASGTSLRGMAAELTKRGIVTPRGGHWDATTVKRLLAR
jgi:DNA invertase Pin-like site-specific DNA recombinase